MKSAKNITAQETAWITGLSIPTINRTYKHPDSGLQKPQRIGRTNYFERSKVYEWLNSRSTRNGEPVPTDTIRNTDKLCNTSDVCELLNRSGAWVWANVTKNPALTIINLSPDGKSKNPRRYFVEREILEAFPELVALTRQEAA